MATRFQQRNIAHRPRIWQGVRQTGHVKHEAWVEEAPAEVQVGLNGVLARTEGSCFFDFVIESAPEHMLIL